MKLEDEIKQSKFRTEYHKLIVNIIYTGSWLNFRQIQFFRAYGLSPQQFNILRILRGQHPAPASVNLLMERMLDKTSNASRLVDKLESKQLVSRKECQADRRQVDVIISQKGLALLEKIDKMQEQEERKYIGLTEKEVHRLNELLDKLRDVNSTVNA